jgi:hypothetical protein
VLIVGALEFLDGESAVRLYKIPTLIRRKEEENIERTGTRRKKGEIGDPQGG